MQGSPRRSGSGGVSGSHRHGGVSMEGSSGGVAASLGEVLWLEAEARRGCGRDIGAEKKNTAQGRGRNLAGGGAVPF
jgi:hypothetical protein